MAGGGLAETAHAKERVRANRGGGEKERVERRSKSSTCLVK